MVRRIVGLGGGGFSSDPFDPVERRLDDLVLSFARRPRPRICFIATASGDADAYTLSFYRAFADRTEPSDLSLFNRPLSSGLRDLILGQDVVYVGGGNTVNMIAVWQSHGLPAILREAWEAGVVMAGVSAGLICWFAEAATFGFGDDRLSGVPGLGLIAGSACAHYSNVAYRRSEYQRLIGEGMAPGIAVDDHVALVYADTELEEVVSTDPAAAAYRVTRGEAAGAGAGGAGAGGAVDAAGDGAPGQVTEERIQPRLLADRP